MSESEDQTVENTSKKKGSVAGLIALVVILLAVIFGLSLYKNMPQENAAESTAVGSVAQDDKDSMDAPIESASTATPAEVASGDADTMADASSDFDFQAAATPRILGNPDAPIKISEHSSFTCGGCAGFHKGNFKMIKQDFIDTGKAYIVFDDFPRNRYDIEVGALARCVPVETYFNFVQLLFETQKTWLNDDFLKHVKQNALLSGTSEAELANCIGNEKLYEVLAERQGKAADEHGVNSTPTLIINDSLKINGLSPYMQIKASLLELLDDEDSAVDAAPEAVEPAAETKTAE